MQSPLLPPYYLVTLLNHKKRNIKCWLPVCSCKFSICLSRFFDVRLLRCACALVSPLAGWTFSQPFIWSVNCMDCRQVFLRLNLLIDRIEDEMDRFNLLSLELLCSLFEDSFWSTVVGLWTVCSCWGHKTSTASSISESVLLSNSLIWISFELDSVTIVESMDSVLKLCFAIFDEFSDSIDVLFGWPWLTMLDLLFSSRNRSILSAERVLKSFGEVVIGMLRWAWSMRDLFKLLLKWLLVDSKFSYF